jgi:hypothetical protein
MKYSISAVTDVGRIRRHNEDMFLIAGDEVIVGEGDHFEAYTEGDGDFLAAIVDGIGGQGAGDLAAHRALEIFNETYRERSTETPLLEVIQLAFQRADESIKNETESNPDFRGAGATVAVLICRGDEAVIAQMCSTAVFLGRNGECLDLFGHEPKEVSNIGLFGGSAPIPKGWDDEFEGVDIGLNFLGGGVAFSAATFTVRQGDSVLLLSDGVHPSFSTGVIGENLIRQKNNEIPGMLSLQANEADGADNGAVICCRFGEPQGQVHYEKLVDSVKFLQFENKIGTFPVLWAKYKIIGAIIQKNFKGARTVAQTIPEHFGNGEILKKIEEEEKRNQRRWGNLFK